MYCAFRSPGRSSSGAIGPPRSGRGFDCPRRQPWKTKIENDSKPRRGESGIIHPQTISPQGSMIDPLSNPVKKDLQSEPLSLSLKATSPHEHTAFLLSFQTGIASHTTTPSDGRDNFLTTVLPSRDKKITTTNYFAAEHLTNSGRKLQMKTTSITDRLAKTACIVVLTCPVLSYQAAGQNQFLAGGSNISGSSSESRYVVDVGGGVANLRFSQERGSIALGVSVCRTNGSSLITIRYIYNREIVLFSPSPPETAWEIGALYGGMVASSLGFASLSAGVSLVGGVRRGRVLFERGGAWSFESFTDYEEVTFHTVGFPLDARLVWTPTPYFGVGLKGFANLNSEDPYLGVLLCFGALLPD